MGIADPDRLYVGGGSYGGFLTAWIIGKTDRFKAAAIYKPVINWIDQALTTDIVHYGVQYQFAMEPWEDPEHYWERSPLSSIENVSTPAMIMIGEQDYRTPVGQGEQYFRALQVRDVDSVLIRMPDSPHNIAGRPSRLIAKVDSAVAWFARYE
jgi:dipeptidyl aminopeptidase/acylaminoacyl peptidase